MPASMSISIIENRPDIPGRLSRSGAKALGETGGFGSIPESDLTRRKMTSPDTKDSGREVALG